MLVCCWAAAWWPTWCSRAPEGDGADWLRRLRLGLRRLRRRVVGHASGAHLNPAVLGVLAGQEPESPGVAVGVTSPRLHRGADGGAFVGVVVCWLAYDASTPPGARALPTIDVSPPGPRSAATAGELLREVIATFVLVYVILVFGETQRAGPLAVACWWWRSA
ncbi:hypothetical protein QJS66_04095 [Kocuria rhizophila]|nr:hypothetical protein QJS66_04095 [Kocuria rhizophila]